MLLSYKIYITIIYSLFLHGRTDRAVISSSCTSHSKQFSEFIEFDRF